MNVGKKRKHGFLDNSVDDSGSPRNGTGHHEGAEGHVGSSSAKPRKKTLKLSSRRDALDESGDGDVGDQDAARKKLEALLSAQLDFEWDADILPGDAAATTVFGEEKLNKRERKRRKRMLESRVAAKESSPEPNGHMEPDEDSILRDDLAVGGFDSDGFDVGVDSDDSEDYGTSDGSGGSDSEEERPVNVRKPAPKVEVVEFRDPSQQRTTASSNPLEFKSFMSSKVSKTLAANAPKTPLPTAAEAAQDKQDDLHDKELMSLLRSTQLIEQLTSAELQGAERRSYLAQRAVELGLRPERRPKVPRAILQGMREKGKERAKKEIQELKETGMLTGSARRKIEARIDAPKRKKKFRPPPNEVGTVGRMNKEGILVVSKRTIKQVEREGEREKAARKRKRDPFGDSSAPKSKGKKKGGKKKRR